MKKPVEKKMRFAVKSKADLTLAPIDASNGKEMEGSTRHLSEQFRESVLNVKLKGVIT